MRWADELEEEDTGFHIGGASLRQVSAPHLVDMAGITLAGWRVNSVLEVLGGCREGPSFPGESLLETSKQLRLTVHVHRESLLTSARKSFGRNCVWLN